LPADRVGAGHPLGFRYVDHAALRVADYDKSLRFYTGKLGFELATEWDLGDTAPGVRFAYLRLGDFQIELIGDGRPALPPEAADITAHLGTGGLIHLCIRVENLDTAVSRLRAEGVEIFAEPFVVEPIGQRLAMIKDNSGNVVELAQSVRSG
jgi:catechol 2,3-dioxygenase-like lactoylglutathione lyase family enzyme